MSLVLSPILLLKGIYWEYVDIFNKYENISLYNEVNEKFSQNDLFEKFFVEFCETYNLKRLKSTTKIS